MKALKIQQHSAAQQYLNRSYDDKKRDYYHTPFELVETAFPECVIDYKGHGAEWGTGIYGPSVEFGCELLAENWDSSG